MNRSFMTERVYAFCFCKFRHYSQRGKKCGNFICKRNTRRSGSGTGDFIFDVSACENIEGSDPKYSDFRLLNTRFKEPALKLKKSVIVAAIFRDGKLIIPSGDTAIRKNDQVIIATSKKMLIRDLNDIL